MSRPLELRLHGVRRESRNVVSLDLRAANGMPLPAFGAGAHIEVEIPVPGGVPLVRAYSLSNHPGETHRYVIGVGRDPQSRGGSSYIHDVLEPGRIVRTSPPRNHFALDEVAKHTVLVAGGIGITPLLSMARRLSEIGRAWTLYYCVRAPADAAFLAALLELPGGEVIPVFDGIPGVASLDLQAVVASNTEDTHFYCCGPQGLTDAFIKATAGLEPMRVHVEWFVPPVTETAVTVASPGSFRLHLARSQLTLDVPADKSVLEVLTAAGIKVPSVCGGGVCGTCVTRVLAGVPDHRDYILTAAEQAAGDQMMVCISRCQGDALTLEL